MKSIYFNCSKYSTEWMYQIYSSIPLLKANYVLFSFSTNDAAITSLYMSPGIHNQKFLCYKSKSWFSRIHGCIFSVLLCITEFLSQALVYIHTSISSICSPYFPVNFCEKKCIYICHLYMIHILRWHILKTYYSNGYEKLFVIIPITSIVVYLFTCFLTTWVLLHKLLVLGFCPFLSGVDDFLLNCSSS